MISDKKCNNNESNNESNNENYENLNIKKVNTQNFIRQIISSLMLDKFDYRSEAVIELIKLYDEKPASNKLSRITYSEISFEIYNIFYERFDERTSQDFNSKSEEKIENIKSNSELLLNYACNPKNKISESIQKLVFKIYDHIQLVTYQIDNIENISFRFLYGGIEDAKEDIHNEIKETQKDYISILGIFASIVLAFVGGSVFSTSAFANAHNLPLLKLLLILDATAFVFINLIYLLINLILHIQDKRKEKYNIRFIMRINKWLFGIAIGILVSSIILVIIYNNCTTLIGREFIKSLIIGK